MPPIPATMKAVRVHGYGPPDVLRYEDAPTPTPAAGEVLIRVHAASINSIDWKLRAGYLQQMIPYAMPVTLGLDFSGTIASVPDATSGHSVGSEVYGRIDMMRPGTYAEYVVAKVGEFTAKPRSADHRACCCGAARGPHGVASPDRGR
jgi:NADPH:quinone reductase-like Zn-dependent oxidoreductase